jgi:L-aspartate oxidase
MPTQSYDFLSIGSGLAGLTFALRAAEHGEVCVLTKAEVTEANTSYAQGGIAAAVGEADSWELHEQDTIAAGAGLCDAKAVRFLVQKAPEAIEWLSSLGAHFDTGPGGGFELGLEGGHSRRRIVHFEDRTGWEVERAVVAAVRAHPRIRVVEHAFVTELLVAEGRCVGAAAMIEGLGLTTFHARATLLATGGCGVMYQHSTNPRVATGDGIGLAHRAGASIKGMEFMQFHPTTLYHPQLRAFLITEACRGAGGTLRNHLGRRFMYDYDSRLELAPRDVVARAIDAEMKRLSTWCVYLDLAHLPPGEVEKEFPSITEKLRSVGLEFDKDWVPVVPAQHYSCGGVATDLDGKTSVPGLYAAGEAAFTGVHGANRLASNSLLEALVFATAACRAGAQEPEFAEEVSEPPSPRCIPETDSIVIRRALQHTMTEKAGIVRSNRGLSEARRVIAELTADYDSKPAAPFSPHPLETLNLLQAAQYVIEQATARNENVGLHYNEDLDKSIPSRG